MSKKYNKVNEIDVLVAFGNIEVIGGLFTPKSLIAQHLNTSMYQVNKHCEELIKKGYLRKSLEEPFHEYDYETCIDYGNSLKIWITEITQDGINKLRELNLYNDRWYENLINEE